MSFTTFVAALRSAIPNLSGFNAKLELPNAYDLPNCGAFLINGWGLTFGPTREERPQYDHTIGNNYGFSVVLTREVLSDRATPTPLITAVCAMQADALLLQQALLATSVLSISDCEIIRYEASSAVKYGNTDNNNWVYMTVSFNTSIREAL